MPRSSRLSMVLALLTLGAAPVRAQRLPMNWNNRTMTGGSLEIMTVDGAGLVMAALRTTHIGDHLVAPDVSWGAGFVNGVLLSTIDFGIGSSVGGQNALLTISGGPTLLAAVAVGSGGSGAGGVFGFHARAGAILPVSDHLGIRFDAARRWFLAGGETYGVWTFGFGATGLGKRSTR